MNATYSLEVFFPRILNFASIRFRSIMICLLLAFSAGAQEMESTGNQVAQQVPLFASNEILHLTLRGNTRALFRDRGDNPSYHKMEIAYDETDGSTVTLPLKVKTRGNFRRQRSTWRGQRGHRGVKAIIHVR